MIPIATWGVAIAGALVAREIMRQAAEQEPKAEPARVRERERREGSRG